MAPLRDLKPASIPTMLSVLEDWDNRCVIVLGEIEGQVRDIRRRVQEQKRKEIEHEKAMIKALGEKEDGKKVVSKRGGGALEDGEEMDVDEGFGGGRMRNAKRGGSKMAGFARRLGGGG